MDKEDTWNSNLKMGRVQVPEKIVSISTGFKHTFMLSHTNRMYAYGDTTMGPKIQSTPVLVHDFQSTQITSFSVGRYHVIATDGFDIYGFGKNVYQH